MKVWTIVNKQEDVSYFSANITVLSRHFNKGDMKPIL